MMYNILEASNSKGAKIRKTAKNTWFWEENYFACDCDSLQCHDWFWTPAYPKWVQLIIFREDFIACRH